MMGTKRGEAMAHFPHYLKSTTLYILVTCDTDPSECMYINGNLSHIHWYITIQLPHRYSSSDRTQGRRKQYCLAPTTFCPHRQFSFTVSPPLQCQTRVTTIHGKTIGMYVRWSDLFSFPDCARGLGMKLMWNLHVY